MVQLILGEVVEWNMNSTIVTHCLEIYIPNDICSLNLLKLEQFPCTLAPIVPMCIR